MTGMPIEVEATVPIFRIFSYEKAIEFYVDFLGFIDKNYRYNKPGLQAQDWGMLECTVVDPFQNRIVFGQYHDHKKRMMPA
jgi:hypothetical protein